MGEKTSAKTASTAHTGGVKKESFEGWRSIDYWSGRKGGEIAWRERAAERTCKKHFETDQEIEKKKERDKNRRKGPERRGRIRREKRRKHRVYSRRPIDGSREKFGLAIKKDPGVLWGGGKRRQQGRKAVLNQTEVNGGENVESGRGEGTLKVATKLKAACKGKSRRWHREAGNEKKTCQGTSAHEPQGARDVTRAIL